MFERDVVGLERQRVFGNRHILGIGASVVPLMAPDALAEDLITRLKPRHVLANRLNVSCLIRSRNTVLWFEEPSPHEAQDIWQAFHDVPDIWMDGSGMNSYQHLIIIDHRLVDVLEFQNIIR